MLRAQEQSPSWEANSRSANQEILCFLRNPKFHYRIHKSQPEVPILSQMNPVNTNISYYSKINFNIILSSTSRYPNGLLP
jgi:hypothetical protein